MHRFIRYELLTTDVAAATDFYVRLLGAEAWSGELSVAALPEPARARGAPAHFRGHVAVGDVESSRAAWLARGAQALGPLMRGAQGELRAGLREPSGAVFSLTSESAAAPGGHIAWHVLHASDAPAALAPYAELFGWVPCSRRDSDSSTALEFAWGPGLPSVGSVTDWARRPEVHPQWQFFFAVSDLERSSALVREAGGLALPPQRGPQGQPAAGCEDAQGAAFGLLQSVD